MRCSFNTVLLEAPVFATALALDLAAGFVPVGAPRRVVVILAAHLADIAGHVAGRHDGVAWVQNSG